MGNTVEDTVREKFAMVLRCGAGPADISLSADVVDGYGLTSMDKVDFLASVAEDTGVALSSFSEEELGAMRTVGDVIELFSRQPASLAGGDVRVCSDGMTRAVTVPISMCSGSSAIYSQIGDWTWEAVSTACGANALTARTTDGYPAYLGFYYFRVLGGRIVHPHGLALGDELHVTSRVFAYGSQSALTLHRLAPAELGLADKQLEPLEYYDNPHPDCLYVENVNRWMARSSPASNKGLIAAAPPEFAYRHLSSIPVRHSPRPVLARARDAVSFYPDVRADVVQTFDYRLDPVSDINGVGLLYFASYFTIFDKALLARWRAVGRSDRDFLTRRVVNQRIGYFGNADPGASFTITIRTWRGGERSDVEIADMAMREAGTGRVLAIAGVEIRVP